MKPQNPPPGPSELREKFDAARRKKSDELEKSGAADILRHLSHSVAALQESGLDISVRVHPGSCADAYHFINALSGANNKGTSMVKAYGFIDFEESSRFFAVTTAHDGVDVERLYVSHWNVSRETDMATPMVSGQYTHYSLPGQIFDFGGSETALSDLQDFLLEAGAQHAAALEYDTANVFNKDAPVKVLPKPVPKLKL